MACFSVPCILYYNLYTWTAVTPYHIRTNLPSQIPEILIYFLGVNRFRYN
jgi:hypothetical protein